jgi:hypothetical protein
VQWADGGHPGLLLGTEPVTCSLWTLFLQHGAWIKIMNKFIEWIKAFASKRSLLEVYGL